jgi:cysteate synthase
MKRGITWSAGLLVNMTIQPLKEVIKMRNHEKLKCLGTGMELVDDGLVLANEASEKPALLRTIYLNKKFEIKDDLPGLYLFSNWLPVHRVLSGSGHPVTYMSRGLASFMGLSRLYITFSGYWESIGAGMTSGTFKECEAYSVCSRFPEDSGKVLVVASAGNTGRAFIRVCSENNIPLVVVVPEKYLDSLWSEKEINPCVKVVAAGGNSDYSDAIRLSDIICGMDGFVSEGGAKNVARRDGMGTTVLSAAAATGEIPDYYFQAVGSGTGAIAAYEANLRLIESGQFGNKKMSLQVSQNAPFLPIYNSWKKGSRAIEQMDEAAAQEQIDCIDAKVLSNRKPPYGIIGGLYDALMDTNGDVTAVTNEEEREARRLFLELEGCDICPEAGVALASLIKKVNEGAIQKDALVMLNITGGGMETLKAKFKTKNVQPSLIIGKEDFTADKVKEKINKLF